VTWKKNDWSFRLLNVQSATRHANSKNSVADGVEIENELTEATEDFGLQSGLISNTILTGGVQSPFPVSELVKIIQGISDGFDKDAEVDVLSSCMVSENDMSRDFELLSEQIALLFQVGDSQDALLLLGHLHDAMRLAFQSFSQCKAPKKFNDDLKKAVRIVDDYHNFAYTYDLHIMIKGLDISLDLEDALVHWDDEKSKFGWHIGHVYSQVLKQLALRETAVVVEQPALLIA